MHYDVFISYRRDGGDSFAMILKNELKERGLKVFHDIESLRSGDFNKQLYQEIEESGKVVLVLPPNALDRCMNDPNDWVRLEIEHALRCGKVIIPIMMRGFVFPEGLPAPLDKISGFQGLEPRMDHTFRSSMDYLVSLIKDDAAVVAQDLSFDMRQVHTFASCGNESTVFKVKKSADGQGISLTVNFEKTRLRDEIPEYAGAYYLKHPAVDVGKASQIRFRARSEDGSIEVLWVEIKPQGKAWMHESFDFEITPELEEYTIDISDFAFPETAKQLEEITFVIKPVSFANQDCLQGALEIRGLEILSRG